jgi:replicative DNA helicase
LREKGKDEFRTAKQQPMKELVHAAINMIEGYHQSGSVLSGISTGFWNLDEITRGLRNGEMIVFGARLLPTLWAYSIAQNLKRIILTSIGFP